MICSLQVAVVMGGARATGHQPAPGQAAVALFTALTACRDTLVKGAIVERPSLVGFNPAMA